MSGIIVFDADNTLWDTNAVFEAAQIALLQTLSDGGMLDKPDTHLKLLRSIDQQLMSLCGRAEYGFDILALALVIFFSERCSIEQAAATAFDAEQAQIYIRYHPLIRAAHEAFDEALRQAPPLFPDAIPTLTLIRASSTPTQRIALIMLSEGDMRRIERILAEHRFRESALFDEILLLDKNVESMAYARSVGHRILGERDNVNSVPAVLVGDSIMRDIKLANQAGFVTIYKPAAFKGFETPQADDETPSRVIRSLAELPHILTLLGFTIPAIAM